MGDEAQQGAPERAPGPWTVLRLHWKQLGRQVWDEIGDNNIGVVAAGVAFYGLLAVIPGLGALITLYGLIAEPAQVEAQIREFDAILPDEVLALLGEQLARNAARPTGALSLELAGAFAVGLWSANRGMKAIISSIHIVHGERDRGLVWLNLLGLLLTLAALVGLCVVLGMLVVLPAIIHFVGIERGAWLAVTMARWPALFGFVFVSLIVMYHVVPRARPPWSLVSVGATIATLLWLLGSWLFSLYVTRFGDYSRIYGSVGAVVVILLWFFVSAFIVMLGAEINSLLAKERRRTGASAPA